MPARPVVDNVLDRQFTPPAKNEAWVSDITYIRTRGGWLYLAVVLDLFSRKVVGWSMAPSMPADLVCTALQMPSLSAGHRRGLSCIPTVAVSTPVTPTVPCWTATACGQA